MTIAAMAIAEGTIGGLPSKTATSTKPPKPRQTIARADYSATPEAR